MKKQLDDILCSKFPEIFRDRYSLECETAMCRGFEHDDGWFVILDCGLQIIQRHIDYKSAPSSKIVDQVVAIQVKEKFGALRFYYNGGDEYIQGVFDMMEKVSSHVCEICGDAGRTRKRRRWLKTLCDKHALEKGYFDEI